jgi:uncharacterized OB-fold protein
VCGPDEDAVTLALAAAERCLIAWTGDACDVDGLYLAFGQGPFLEGPQAQFVLEGLGMDPASVVSVFSGEALSALSALASARDAVETGRADTILVIATEGGGSQAGDPPSAAAAAVIVELAEEDSGGVVMDVLGQLNSINFDRWRNSPGDAPSRGDYRQVQEHYVTNMTTLVDTVMTGTDWDAPVPVVFSGGENQSRQDVIAAVPNLKDAGSEERDFGVASPLLAFVEGVAASGSGEFLMLAHGTSRSLAARFTATAGHSGKFRPDRGANAIATAADSVKPHNPVLSLPTKSPFYSRNIGELIRLDAAKCKACGSIAFPPSQRPVCPACQAADWEPYRLARTGVVHTFTVNKFLPVGFGDEMAYVLADLEDGTQYWAPVSDLDPGSIEIGMAVHLVIRRFTVQAGVPLYSMKFVGDESSASQTRDDVSGQGG